MRMACKPGSVRGACAPLDDHSSAPMLARGGQAANPDLGLKRPCGGIPEGTGPARSPYSALLPVGLAMPVRLPVPRWALTPPFHPCHACMAVCSLWRCPSGCPGRALPGTVASWSPDFPRRRTSAVIRPSASALRISCAAGLVNAPHPLSPCPACTKQVTRQPWGDHAEFW